MRIACACLSLGTAANGFVVRQPHAFLSKGAAPVTQHPQQHVRREPRCFSTPPSPHRRRSRVKLSAEPPSGSMSSSPSSSGASATGDGGLILGVNKYSHDSAVCVLNASDGNCLFAGEKERLTRSKHDGGDTGDLVAHALESIGASLEDVRLVVSNNHHHRVAPFERRIPWAVATGAYPESYAAPENTLPAAAHAELSHHLAHAWSAASLAPFDSGLIVVMDGMGEAHGAMAKSEAAAVALQAAQLNNRAEHDGAKPGEEEYYNDLRLMRELGAGGEMAEGAKVPGGGNPGFQQVPQELLPHEAYREAESAYTFVPGLDGGPPILTPIFKRWTLERSPPELHNHGFENMESMGAVYSRVSSHIFGDWNACGKVMGLAPWASKWPLSSADPSPLRLTSGDLLSDGHDGNIFRVNWDAIEQLRRPNELGDENLRPYYAALAATAQAGLEEAALAFVAGLRERTGETNVCLCGGVALNSVLNGKVAREAGFERVFVPPCPGDEGIAVGCAAFGWHQRGLLLPPIAPAAAPAGAAAGVATDGAKGGLDSPENRLESAAAEETKASGGGDGDEAASSSSSAGVGGGGEGGASGVERGLRAPFWGKSWTSEEVDDELAEWAPWLEVRDLDGVEEVAEAIAGGQVVAWFQGRGEFGPRALGCRSLLADPRDPKMPTRINTHVKKREDFRPFAPSALAEEAGAWFEGLPLDGSPYMSLTAPVKPEIAEKIPAVCHVDGSSRLQTVRKEDNPLYHRLISAFFKVTGVPMVLNTSFNVMGEPIVNSPEDAIRAMVGSSGAIDMLVLHDKVVTLRPFPASADEWDEEAWQRLWPTRRYSFLSEVTERGSGMILRVRVKPQDGREQWVELENDLQLDMLELADGSLSLGEMIEEVVEGRMSQEQEDEDEDEGDEEYEYYSEGEEEEEEEGEEGGGEEEEEDRESGAVASVTDEVLQAMRALFSKGLIGFDV